MAQLVVGFAELAVDEIEKLAQQVIGDIIQAIENLITNPADNPVREAFTQGNCAKVAQMCSDPINVIIIISTDPHDASELISNGYKQAELKCPCPAANNTLQYDCYVGKAAATFHLKGDGGYINWAFSGVFNRHDNDVSFSAL